MATWACWAAATAALVVAMAPSRRASAEPDPPRIELRWQAPDECPDALAMTHAIEGFLGQPMSAVRAQALSIRAHLLGDAAHGYAGKLSIRGDQGSSERALEHPDCTKLTEGIALLAALAIDPERVRTQQEARHSPPPEPPEPPEATSEPSPAPAPPIALAPPAAAMAASGGRDRDRESSGARFEPSVTVHGLVGGGPLPSVAPGLGLELGLQRSYFEAALIVRGWAARGATVPGAPDARIDISLLSAGLRLCGVPTHRAWSLQACARADLESMAARGEGVDNARSRNAWFAALGGSLAVGYRVGRVTPRAGAELLGSPDRPRFGVLQEGVGIEAFTPKAWQIAGFVGLAYLL